MVDIHVLVAAAPHGTYSRQMTGLATGLSSGLLVAARKDSVDSFCSSSAVAGCRHKSLWHHLRGLPPLEGPERSMGQMKVPRKPRYLTALVFDGVPTYSGGLNEAGTCTAY
jgi:hypothetical protein